MIRFHLTFCFHIFLFLYINLLFKLITAVQSLFIPDSKFYNCVQ